MDDMRDEAERAFCRDTEEILFSYLANELDDGKAEMVRLHLCTCEKCKREAESIKRTVELLSAPALSGRKFSIGSKTRRRLRRAVLHPAMEWIYAHRKTVAALSAILVFLLVLALAWHARTKPEFDVYWLK